MEIIDDAHVTLSNGVEVGAWVTEDGAVVVQIDTPPESDAHEKARVYLNDAPLSF
jgi:ribosomal protein S12